MADKITAAALPKEVRLLLDHRRSMTATLAGYWQGDITARVLVSDHTAQPDRLQRFTTLVRASDALPVALAALSVHLPAIGPDVGGRLMTTSIPFGRLLLDAGIAFTAEPLGFFAMTADRRLAALGGITEGKVLFGRIVRLIAANHVSLGGAVEILPRY
ncbi:MAG TPA: hypothetical protein VEB64_00010 [Azospirillaceae bacterium]|nr:hypothetical protein [Azospirillaceae bacterium]